MTLKDIVGYENKYAIDEHGIVYSYNFHREGSVKPLKPKIGTRGYARVGLRKNGKQRLYLVHRLVAEAFIQNPSNLPQVNHLDGNKLNNSVHNLEWCTQSENVKHAYSAGLLDTHGRNNSGEKNPRSILTEKEVLLIRELHPSVSYSKLSAQFGVSKSAIAKLIKKKNWGNVSAY